MKRISMILLCMVAVFTFSGCGMAVSEQTSSAETVPQGKGKTLVVYFSMPETDTADSMTEDEDNSVVVINGQVLGNTQYVAAIIQERTGADLFRIEPKTPYPTDHEELVRIAQEERTGNARPELKGNVEDLESYDTIFVGYPIWWSDFPMIVYTFFDENDFSGKEIIPFSTHGGSGLAGTVQTIKELEPRANVSDSAFSVSRDDVHECKNDLIDWLGGLGY